MIHKKTGSKKRRHKKVGSKKQLKIKLRPKYVYPDVEVRVCVGNEALTCAHAKQLLGWKTETRTVKFHDRYLFKDEENCKVQCSCNRKNRPFDDSWARSIAQDILNKRWKLNLETIIIGRDGQVLSGQHRLIGLILACQLWQKHSYWSKVWNTEPSIETLVAFGADESEEATRTLDNVKPRTLADVLFMSKTFAQHRPKDRKPITRILDYAVRLLWKRTGASNNAFLPRRTHSEALEFISNHPKIVPCVKHVYDEDCAGSIKKYISLGYAAGLMYLMAASDSDYDAYSDKEPHGESRLIMTQWEIAAEFWSEFSVGDSLKPLQRSLNKLAENLEEDTNVQIGEKLAMIVKAWQVFRKKKRLVMSDCALAYTQDEAGFRVLDEHPRMGGIDIG